MTTTADSDPKPIPERIAIFVDFWNFELSCKEVDSKFRTDWPKMGQIIYSEAVRLLAPGHGAQYCGMFVFGSYNPATETPLHRWATTTLPSFPGITSTFVPRRRQVSGPTCPVCHCEVKDCPYCANSMLGMKEKCVDTLVATDMIRLAWEELYDAAILVTADSDLVPVVKFLATKGKKILHGRFPPLGAQLAQSCWAHMDLPALMPNFA